MCLTRKEEGYRENLPRLFCQIKTQKKIPKYTRKDTPMCLVARKELRGADCWNSGNPHKLLPFQIKREELVWVKRSGLVLILFYASISISFVSIEVILFGKTPITPPPPLFLILLITPESTKSNKFYITYFYLLFIFIITFVLLTDKDFLN